jgi:hypothetical protein
MAAGVESRENRGRSPRGGRGGGFLFWAGMVWCRAWWRTAINNKHVYPLVFWMPCLPISGLSSTCSSVRTGRIDALIGQKAAVSRSA